MRIQQAADMRLTGLCWLAVMCLCSSVMWGEPRAACAKDITEAARPESGKAPVAATAKVGATSLDATQTAAVERKSQGSIVGVGIQIEATDAGVLVKAVLPDSPAEKAGLQAGWIIESIDGTVAKGMEMEKAVSLLRGEVGSVVQLDVRTASGESRHVSVTRDKIAIGAPKTSMAADEIGMVHIVSFNPETADNVRKAIADLQSRGAKAIILDLRGPAGGAPGAIEQVAGVFLVKGSVLWWSRIKKACAGRCGQRAPATSRCRWRS
jgi:C-terminal peptidase prc